MDFKKKYIDMRNRGKYELDFFFQYYLSKGGKLTDPNEFTEEFIYSHQEVQTPPGFPAMKVRNGENNRDEIIFHMDKVFELKILEDKEGKFIKVVE